MKSSGIKFPKPKLLKQVLPEIKSSLRLFLYAETLILAVLSLLQVKYGYLDDIPAGILYGFSGGAVGLSCCYLCLDISKVVNDKIIPCVEANHFTKHIVKDYRYRSVLVTYLSLGLNLIFAFSNGIFGITSHSVWFGTLSAYYIVLSVMRFIVVQYERKVSGLEKTQEIRIQELTVYRNCGILFILMTLALGVSVIQMIYFDMGRSYPGTLIFLVAAYTFYKVILAVINLIKAGKLKSPLIMTIRNIAYADAIVSMFSLQTAMFVSFGSEDGMKVSVMNRITGGCVCLMILAMGIYMIRSTHRQK